MIHRVQPPVLDQSCLADPSTPTLYPIEVSAGPACPIFKHAIGRVNVILGSNGTGKTHLLRNLRGGLGEVQTLRGAARIAPVDGNRVLLTTGQSSRPRNESAQPLAYISKWFANEQYDRGDLQRFADSVLEALCQDHSRVAQEHSDECHKLAATAVAAQVPLRTESKLDRFIFLWNRIFPKIELDFDVNRVSVKCHKGGHEYQPDHLSTGEKQVFLLLGRFFVDDQPEIFLIDEPDRNLNPRLAEAFWSTIEETHHENSLFIYATHLPSFALRPGVDRVFLIDGRQTVELDGHDGFIRLPSRERVEFLGAIPSIVIRDKVLVVEGEDDGIDRQVFEYIIGENSGIEVVPLRGCDSVKHAVEGATPWQRITADVAMVGIVDRDYRSDETLERLASPRLLVLPFHEIESVLCHPELIERACEKKFAKQNRPSREAILDRFCNIADAASVKLAMRRTNERLKNKISVSTVTSQELASVEDAVGAKEILGDKRTQFRDYVATLDHETIFDGRNRRSGHAAKVGW